MAVPISQKFLLFSQMREALRRRLSVHVGSHLPSAQNKPYAEVAYLEWCTLIPYNVFNKCRAS